MFPHYRAQPALAGAGIKLRAAEPQEVFRAAKGLVACRPSRSWGCCEKLSQNCSARPSLRCPAALRLSRGPERCPHPYSTSPGTLHPDPNRLPSPERHHP